ncbi:uncharacterized protein LOC105159486 isoform X1 [Sesamum indicum]|uniref:Uncharacterized protein LOC105159486 isoform X1 n=1 Tax=Sesamum indicum TaxID=4182 RepID=A0A6I9SZ05_SESIN|nr:uncharacterized protein LOC105159486 isoform X1 [Sesamum indicum]
MEETQTARGNSMAAPAIFFLVFSFHFASKCLDSYTKKKGSIDDVDAQLRAEINKLLKEASSLSQPSTFAQAAKLKRMAAAKEKELAKHQEMHDKDIKSSFDKYGKPLMILKVLMYVLLTFWFWRAPVATIPSQLAQPFGKMLSWTAGPSIKDNVKVGIIPWMVISFRVSKLICRKMLKFK